VVSKVIALAFEAKPSLGSAPRALQALASVAARGGRPSIDPRNPAVVQVLQRTVGNRVTTTLIQRDAPTVNINDLPMADEGQEKIRQAAMTLLGQSAEEYANLWLSAAHLALDQAPEPDVDDPNAKANFYVAMAGNMLWASTSLFPEWRLAMVPMSFGGAFAGSGGMAAPAPAAPPSGKPVLISKLTQSRDRMVAGAHAVVARVASDCAADNISDVEQQKQKLWATVFPGIPYQVSDAIRAQALTQLTALVADFRAQYDAWDKSTRAEAFERQMSAVRAMSPAGAPPSPLNQPVNYLEQVRRERPFQPNVPAVANPTEQKPSP